MTSVKLPRAGNSFVGKFTNFLDRHPSSKKSRREDAATEVVCVIAGNYVHTFDTEKPLPAWAEEKVALLRAALDGDFAQINGVGDVHDYEGQYMFTLHTKKGRDLITSNKQRRKK